MSSDADRLVRQGRLVSGRGRETLIRRASCFARRGLARLPVRTDSHGDADPRRAEPDRRQTRVRDTTMIDCIFCDIAGGRATASVVYRDDRVTGFLDHNPVTPGHLM